MAEPGKFWDVRADKYASRPVKDFESYEKGLERTRAHLGPDDDVLEFGCGTGTTALLLAPATGRILATDVSRRMIEIGQEKVAEQSVTNVRFEQTTLEGEKLGAGSFDAVLGFNIVHLLHDVPASLARVHELLKPEGLFISKTVCLGEQTRLWSLVIGLARLVGIAPEVHCLSFAQLEDAIRDAGFEIVETGTFPKSPPSRFVVARKLG